MNAARFSGLHPIASTAASVPHTATRAHVLDLRRFIREPPLVRRQETGDRGQKELWTVASRLLSPGYCPLSKITPHRASISTSTNPATRVNTISPRPGGISSIFPHAALATAHTSSPAHS